MPFNNLCLYITLTTAIMEVITAVTTVMILIIMEAIMEVIMSAAEVGKSYFTTPGAPIERVTILRRAFDAMARDPAFIAAMRKIGGDVGPMRGEDVQAMIAQLDALSPDLIARVKSVYNEQ